MSEIDYKEFCYKRPTKSTSNEPETPLEKPQKPKRKRLRALFVVFLIAVLILILILCSDFLTGKKLIDKVSSFVGGNTYTYYVVVAIYENRDQAYAQSLAVKQMGGSGYINIDEKQYYVVYSAFCAKNHASSVANKNANTSVITKNCKSRNNKVYNACNKVITSLIDMSVAYDGGTLNEKSLKVNLDTYVSDLTEAKSLAKYKEDNALLDLGIDIISSIDVSLSKIELLNRLRYAYSMLIFGMTD